LLSIKSWHTVVKHRINERKKQTGHGQEIGWRALIS
jgi:hypothetical protein